MRIAVSGSHATGKTTLARELANRFPRFQVVDEAYLLLTDEGVAFGDPPGPDDFEAMFERAIAALRTQTTTPLLFDRSPADYLAYLAAHSSGALGPNHDHIEAARSELRQLDLVVFVPIEQPDRISPTSIRMPRLRRRVDRLLRAMLVDDEWGFAVPVLEVSGTLTQRLDQTCTRIAKISAG